jgi:DNA polymerase III sliding clamp (beta) subunit (PCNA family)
MDVTIEADHATQIFDKMSNLITEAILRFEEDRLVVTTCDPAVVSMIHLEIPEDSFKKYDVTPEDYNTLTEEGEDGILLGVSLENFSTVTGVFDEEINISVEIESSNIVLTEDDDRYELPILNLSTDEAPDMDRLEQDIQAELDLDQFKELRKKLGIADDSCQIKLTTEGELEVSGGGNQMEVETNYELGEAEVVSEEFDGEEVESMFALDYLKKAERMFNKIDTCDSLQVRMAQEFPMEMTHDCDRETLKFVIAPRVMDE